MNTNEGWDYVDIRVGNSMLLSNNTGSYLTEITVRYAKGYDFSVRIEVRTSRKTLYLSVLLRDMIAVEDFRFSRRCL
jgi:hypothetical protein